MEKIKQNLKNASLKKSFIFAVSCTVFLIVALSLTTIWLCAAFQSWLMPEPNKLYLTISTTYADGSVISYIHLLDLTMKEQNLPILIADENSEMPAVIEESYSLSKVETSYTSLTPKRKIAYTCCSILMIAFPFLYSVTGILLCALWFYKKKLKTPIGILSEATSHIAEKNLDFIIQYDSLDEMGELCNSFEKMRQALYENNRELWSMLEERKLLWASVAHDLRNPIAIIEGYAEHLQLSIASGRLNHDKLQKTASHLQNAAKRLETYTDSIRNLNHLEEMEIHRSDCMLPDILTEIVSDFSVVAEQKQITYIYSNSVPCCKAFLDKQVLYRILENIFTNALRYAKKLIIMEFTIQNDELSIRILDDGEGFSPKILQKQDRYLIDTDKPDGHMGMGITISRILCKKHSGSLTLTNCPPQGACVTIKIKI